MSRLDTLTKPLAREGASHSEAVIERVLLEEYGWTRAMVADFLREVRKRA